MPPTLMQIKLTCNFCQGTGLLGGDEHNAASPCAFCIGRGCVSSLTLESGYFYSADVIGCIDFDEFKNLNTGNSQACALILSAGFVNLNQGSAVRTKLLSVFPSGTTHNNLLQLIS